jgi:hypothetical protein
VAGQVILAALFLGCQRKAPGPDECVAFAKALLHQPRFGVQELVFPGTAPGNEAFEKLVQRCLTEPFDRAFVDCVVRGGRPEHCQRSRVERVQIGRRRVE